jgi:hypothetical protein
MIYYDQIKENELSRKCNIHRNMRNAHKMLASVPEGKRQFERPRQRWEDNIKMDLRIGSNGKPL